MAPSAKNLREIRPEVSYPMPVFMDASGIGRAGLREARRNGLQVRYVGGRCFIRGADWIQYVEEHGKPVKAGATASKETKNG